MTTKAKWLLIPIFILIFSSLAHAENFSDNEPGDGNFVAVTYLKEIGLLNGYPDNTFKAWEKINRAEALKMLMLANGEITEKDFEDAQDIDLFIDTPKNAWYSKYLAVAKQKGLISGYEDNSFKPEENINLVEALKIYLESYDDLIYPLTENHVFADTVVNDWYAKYVAYADSRDMLDITVSNEIWPTRKMSRGELAEMIYKKKKFSEGYRFGKATFYGAAVQGNNTASGEIFDMYKMTAAHKTLAFGTIVEVTNLANGESVEVKITDRGPHGPGRVLDLTSAAFDKIGWLGSGVINIQYKVVSSP